MIRIRPLSRRFFVRVPFFSSVFFVHDGWSSYDRFRQAWHQQCVGHVMRRARKMLETAVGGAVHFPREILLLFKEALALRDRFEQGELTANDLADGYPANHLREWFWFLLEPGLDATNYRGEQSMRLGVINRKVWGGNRNDTGARAQEVHRLAAIRVGDQSEVAKNTMVS